MGVLLVFSLIGGWFLAGYMLRPVQQIADAARLAAQGSLSHRVNLVGHNDEFGELADTFDMMLARLETHVDEYRRFAANASHELRTPLATAQSMLDVALRNPNRDIDQLLQRLHQVNARSIALTEALLTLSRADQRSFTPEPVDLSLLVEESMELLLPFAEQRGVNIETASAVTLASGSRTLLGQLTTNLLHNAIVHNYPTEGTVKVATAVVGGLAALTVENTGNLLDPQLVATLTQPFQRGTQRARSGTPGHGLGLAIVQSIVQAHKGTLILTPQVQGGLRVTVQLPVNQSS
jgi:two-component system sensor histidine kinase VanS